MINKIDLDSASKWTVTASAVRLVRPVGSSVLVIGERSEVADTQLVDYDVSWCYPAEFLPRFANQANLSNGHEGDVDVVVLDDALGRLPRDQRPTVLKQASRLALHVLIVVDTFADSAVEQVESLLREAYSRLTTLEHPILADHARFGLPGSDELQAALETGDWTFGTTQIQPLDVWVQAKFLDFVALETGEGARIGPLIKPLLEQLKVPPGPGERGYRQLIVAGADPLELGEVHTRRRPSKHADFLVGAAFETALATMIGQRTFDSRMLARRFERALADLDDLKAAAKADHHQLRQSQAARSHASNRIEVLEQALTEERTQKQFAERQELAQRGRLQDETRRHALARDSLEVADKALERHKRALENSTKDLSESLLRIYLTRDRLIDQLARLLAENLKDSHLLLTSRKYRVGDRIGNVLEVVSPRRGHEKAGDRLQTLQAGFDEWSDRTSRLEENLKVDELRRRITSQSEDMRRLQEGSQVFELEYRKLMSSRRWKLGKALGSTLSLFSPRRRGEPATSRIDRRLGEATGFLEQVAWTASRFKDDTRLDETKRGVSAGADAAAAQRRYETYLQEVEPALLESLMATGPATEVHAVVVHAWARNIAANDDETPARRSLARAGISAVTDIRPAPEVDVSIGTLVNKALASIKEDLFVLIGPTDVVSPVLPNALGTHPNAAAVVVDHDLISEKKRTSPSFKPSFSPEWLLETDYVSRGVVFRTESVRQNGGFPHRNRDLARDMLLRMWDAGHEIEKIDAVLMHIDNATLNPDPDQDVEFSKETLKRRGLASRSQVARLAFGSRVRYLPESLPLVSILIPFREHPELLDVAVRSVLRLTTYPHYEIVLIDNGSVETETKELVTNLMEDRRVRVVEAPGEFNYSSVNNVAVNQSEGDVLVFLNSDTKLLSPDWLQDLVGFATQADIGAVGAKLHYRNGSIQHAGVVVGVNGFAAHVFDGEHESFVPSHVIRHTRNVSAVTAACLAIERTKFDHVGGFDEQFVVTGQDVDLCLRLMKAGYRNVFSPAVELFHYHRQSRADRPIPRGDEVLSLRRYQPYVRDGDRYWNLNLSRLTTRMEPRIKEERVYEDLRRRVIGDDRTVRGARGFLREYDLSEANLAENQLVINSFRENRSLSLGAATWFIPHFDHVYRGGIHTIMRFADHFTQKQNTLNHFVVYGRDRGDVEGMSVQIAEAYPRLRFEMHLLPKYGAEAELPSADIGICTLWTSAYHLLRYNQCRGKFYLVQDFEPAFTSANSVYGLIEETYRFGFSGIANTPGVAEAYGAYGNEVVAFLPAVDRTVYYPPVERDEGPMRIVFYGRPNNPRNGFELGSEALSEAKRRHGDRVEIYSAGAEFIEADHGLDGVLTNLGVLANTQEVADLYRRADIGLVFMYTKHPSYQPLEYMACGTATVTNYNEANSWLLEHGHNAMCVAPTVTAVADAVSTLIENSELRSRVVSAGLETAAATRWEDQLEIVNRYVTKGELPQ